MDGAVASVGGAVGCGVAAGADGSGLAAGVGSVGELAAGAVDAAC